MASKFLPDETIDLRVTYDYYGNPRTMVTDISTSVLHSLSFTEFEEYIKQVRLTLYAQASHLQPHSFGQGNS